jgi:conjugative transposon TraN protein
MKYNTAIIIGFLFINLTMNSQTNLIPISNSDTLFVSDIKTTHLLFEENVKYIDIGSPYFIADTLQKMIRIKHTGKGLTDIKSLETNLTIISEKGNYYSMFLGFNRFSPDLNYEVKPSEQIIPSYKEAERNKVEKTNNITSVCGVIQNLDSNVRIKSRSENNLEIKVSGIYYVDEKIALKLVLTNASGVDFDIDQILFRAKLNKKFSADYIYQERIIPPLSHCNTGFEIKGNSNQVMIFLFDKFMINNNEKFYIDVFEQNGGRSATVNIPRKKLSQPKII